MVTYIFNEVNFVVTVICIVLLCTFLIKKSNVAKMSGLLSKSSHDELENHVLRKRGKKAEYIKEIVCLPFIFLSMKLSGTTLYSPPP